MYNLVAHLPFIKHLAYTFSGHHFKHLLLSLYQVVIIIEINYDGPSSLASLNIDTYVHDVAFVYIRALGQNCLVRTLPAPCIVYVWLMPCACTRQTRRCPKATEIEVVSFEFISRIYQLFRNIFYHKTNNIFLS